MLKYKNIESTEKNEYGYLSLIKRFIRLILPNLDIDDDTLDSSSNDAFLAKIDTLGELQWVKKYNTIAGRSKDMFDSFRMPTKEEIKSLQNIYKSCKIKKYIFINFSLFLN